MMRLMDSGTCAKRLKSPDLHTKEHAWGSEIFFSGGRQQWILSGGGQTHCSRSEPAVVKFHFHFTNCKLRDKHFSTKKLIGKYQVPKSRWRLVVVLFRLLMFCSKVVMFYHCWLIISSMLLISFKTQPIGLPYPRQVPGLRGGIECSTSWIYWVIRRCPWNGHGKSLL